MSVKGQVFVEKSNDKKAEDLERNARAVEFFIMGKSYKVPAGQTI